MQLINSVPLSVITLNPIPERGFIFWPISCLNNLLAMKWSLLGLYQTMLCSIKSALWLSSYVPLQCLEWLLLIDVAAKCQVLSTVIVRHHAAVFLHWPLRFRRKGRFFFFSCAYVWLTLLSDSWKDYYNVQGWKLLWMRNVALEYSQYVLRWVKRSANGCCII